MEPLEKTSIFNENNAYDFLKKRKGLIDGVVISGGEPTLQKDLNEVCRHIKQLGFPVKLDTNGSRPSVIKHLIENKLVDYIAMDIKTDPPLYSPIITKYRIPENIEKSIQKVMESSVLYEFKTTCVRPLVDENIIQKISRLIKGARLFVLQQFHDTGVLHPEFFKENPNQYSKKDLLQFKSIADPWVQECLVR